jgi:hypothetical protein
MMKILTALLALGMIVGAGAAADAKRVPAWLTALEELGLTVHLTAAREEAAQMGERLWRKLQ